MKSSFHPLLLTCVIVLSASDLLQAAPPPELTVLRQQYDKVFAERVTAVHEANVAALGAKFTTALDNAITQAKSAGDLPTVLAIQADKKLLAEKQPLPTEDAEGTPEPLKKLRIIYREQLGKLTAQRIANTTALLVPYTAKLQQLEGTLTKNDRVEEAKSVMDYRTALTADAPVPAAATAATPPDRTPSTPPPSPAAETTKLPKGDERKAAEWLLSFATPGSDTQVTVQVGNLSTRCVKPTDLPPGKFLITHFMIDGFHAPLPRPLNNADTTVLSGLAALTRFQINKAGIADEGLKFVTTCPQLSTVLLHNLNLTGEVFQHLAQVKALTRLDLTGSYAKMGWAGFRLLSGSGISELILRIETFPDEGVPHLAGLMQLVSLDLRGAAITDTGVVPLAELTKLTSLNLSLTNVTPQGLLKLRGLKLKELSFGRKETWLELAPQLPAVAGAFPDVEATELPRGGSFTTASVEPLCAAFPKLRVLQADDAQLNAGTAQALTRFTKLEELVLTGSTTNDSDLAVLSSIKSLRRVELGRTQITDSGLDLLAKMKNLKVLTLPKPGKGVTAEAIAKFKKQRPDVRVN